MELIRAYGNMLKLVLTRGKLLQQLQSAIAAMQQAAEAHPAVPVALEAACHNIKHEVAKVDAKIKVSRGAGVPSTCLSGRAPINTVGTRVKLC